MSAAILLMLLALPLLLLASGFFSGSETALFSLSHIHRAQLAQSSSVTNIALSKLLEETRGLLITLLLGNMTANVMYFVISSVLLIAVSRNPLIHPLVMVLAAILPLITIILLGEVLPKLIAARLALRWSRWVALPLLAIHRLVGPVRITCSMLIISPLARLIAPRSKPPDLSANELESLLKISQKQGVIDPDEERILQQVLELGQIKVRELMTPRVDIQAFDLADPPDKLLDLIRRTRLRHVPVYRQTIDHIEGLVYSRLALLDPPQSDSDLKKLIRPVKFVPLQQRADHLLVDLRTSGDTFAIVVDEYGGTAGLATIEDVVEHMVGDIPGTFQTTGEPQVQTINRSTWRAGADLSVREWSDLFRPIPTRVWAAPDTQVSTLGGLVMARLGRVPRIGDHIQVGNLVIGVERMDGTRIETVTIELADDSAWKEPTSESH